MSYATYGDVERLKLPNDATVIFSGAGISAESGLATFRDPDGIWTKTDLSEVCNYLTWERNTDKVFKFYTEKKRTALNAQPNMAHYAVAKFINSHPDKVVNITMNVDNLFEKAGCGKTFHVHGDMEHQLCKGCGEQIYIGTIDYIQNMRCNCGCTKTKPSIVFFNEMAPMYSVFNKVSKVKFGTRSERTLIVIGTSFEVIQPQFFDMKAFPRRILINKEQTPYDDYFTETYYGNASALVPKILNQIYNKE